MEFKDVGKLPRNLIRKVLNMINRRDRTLPEHVNVKKNCSGSGLRPYRPYRTWGRAISHILNQNSTRMMAIACLCAAVVFGLGLMLPGIMSDDDASLKQIKTKTGESVSNTSEVPRPAVSEEPRNSEGDKEAAPKQPQIMDLSGIRMDLETAMLQINEPTPYGRELLYSAGSASSIDSPVLTKLFLYNLDTKQETEIAETKVKFGEIYEARFNEDWIVWLDTNQSGTNYIYALNRKSGEVTQVKRCELNKPQLVLYGDNLVWVEQKDEENDRLYLYNFKSGEPVILDSFNNPTYGTCPPALYNDVLVWVYPSPQDDSRSIIKKLNLKEALSVGTATQQATSSEGSAGSESLNSAANGVSQQEESMTAEDGAEQADDQGVEPKIIDPKGFAIYPQTNGEVIAWLDNLDPSRAKLMMTRDDGENIKVVAENVGRLFGVGDKFIVYTQEDSIMLYFWEIDRYARLTKPGEKGMLSKACVSGNVVVWYEVNDPAQRKDRVKISIIQQPTI